LKSRTITQDYQLVLYMRREKMQIAYSLSFNVFLLLCMKGGLHHLLSIAWFLRLFLTAAFIDRPPVGIDRGAIGTFSLGWVGVMRGVKRYRLSRSVGTTRIGVGLVGTNRGIVCRWYMCNKKYYSFRCYFATKSTTVFLINYFC
jgi:hypothetical protein